MALVASHSHGWVWYRAFGGMATVHSGRGHSWSGRLNWIGGRAGSGPPHTVAGPRWANWFGAVGAPQGTGARRGYSAPRRFTRRRSFITRAHSLNDLFGGNTATFKGGNPTRDNRRPSGGTVNSSSQSRLAWQPKVPTTNVSRRRLPGRRRPGDRRLRPRRTGSQATACSHRQAPVNRQAEPTRWADHARGAAIAASRATAIGGSVRQRFRQRSRRRTPDRRRQLKERRARRVARRGTLTADAWLIRRGRAQRQRLGGRTHRLREGFIRSAVRRVAAEGSLS